MLAGGAGEAVSWARGPLASPLVTYGDRGGQQRGGERIEMAPPDHACPQKGEVQGGADRRAESNGQRKRRASAAADAQPREDKIAGRDDGGEWDDASVESGEEGSH